MSVLNRRLEKKVIPGRISAAVTLNEQPKAHRRGYQQEVVELARPHTEKAARCYGKGGTTGTPRNVKRTCPRKTKTRGERWGQLVVPTGVNYFTYDSYRQYYRKSKRAI